MTDRERFVNCILGKPVDRPPYLLAWGPWGTTWERWKKEGMPESYTGYHNVVRALGVDVGPQVVPVNCGPCPSIEQVRLEEDDTSYVYIDSWGIKRRNAKGHESMSEFLSFPVKTREDWVKFKAERLDPNHPGRLGGDWEATAKLWVANGAPIQLGSYPDVGIFGTLRWLLGDEECLLAFCTDPDLVHEIMDHMTTLYLTVFAAVVEKVPVDVIHIWEDMCGRQGPLIGPDTWEEFMGPCYRRIRDFARAHNITVISVDTDGRPDLIVPPMMRNGVNYLFPMEVAAGTDVNDFQQRYPALAMLGGIDKRELANGPAAIDRELARITPAIRRGRYIADLDHLVPDDVSWDNFCYYAKALKKIVVGA